MARAGAVRLSKRVIEQAVCEVGKDTILRDTERRGLRVRKQPRGESWVFEYRYRASGRDRLMTLGKLGEITVEQARALADIEAAKVAFGGDPQADKVEKRLADRDKISVAEAVNFYLTQGPTDKPDKRASSWSSDATAFNRHLNPLLGKRRLASLTTADLSKWQNDVAMGKTAKSEKMGVRGLARVTGGKGAAQRGMLAVSAMLAWCVKRKLLTENPARDVARYQSGGHERFLSAEEGVKLWEAIESLEAEKGISQAQASVFRLLALTGARRGEIVGLRWPEVDLKRGLLLLPPLRHKSGQSARPKAIPLPQAARDILQGLSRNSEWVFPKGDNSGPIEPPKVAWTKVTTRAGLQGLRMHDLRHTFASWAVGAGVALPIIGKLLGHASPLTTQRYAHLRADAGAEVLEAISSTYRVPTVLPQVANDGAPSEGEAGGGHE
jgi:integrase